ncbi:PspC domain-containing protein [Saccharomonospora sp. CUA-673]|uniref:PspC domain-containing protein n=1 Tax=Saccharomonospora sp. CUA-673 TaxID=1904969 RepID=UPI002101A00F|nr:PspC domain-containing protein [Saccharomonospora sp. CUA-673]
MNSTSSATRHLEGFRDVVKDFWVSRPRRPSEGRKAAGVAAGIGTRYGVDPIVVRVALVALTFFGGVGPAVYLLGWLFLPAEDDEVSAFEALLGHGHSNTGGGTTVVLSLACFPAFGMAFGGTWLDGGGILGLALVVTALYLLHRGRGQHNRPPERGPVPGTTTAARTAKGSPVDTTSDDWDALGAGPLGWDLADRTVPPTDDYQPDGDDDAEPERPPRRRSKLTPVTLGLATVAAGLATLVAVLTTNPAWTAATVAGIALAVIGGGLLIGAFLGAGRGLIGAAVPLAAVAVVLSFLPPDGYGTTVGELRETPTGVGAVQPVYERGAGRVEVDLSRLDVGSDNADPVTTTLRVAPARRSCGCPRTRRCGSRATWASATWTVWTGRSPGSTRGR